MWQQKTGGGVTDTNSQIQSATPTGDTIDTAFDPDVDAPTTDGRWQFFTFQKTAGQDQSGGRPIFQWRLGAAGAVQAQIRIGYDIFGNPERFFFALDVETANYVALPTVKRFIAVRGYKSGDTHKFEVWIDDIQACDLTHEESVAAGDDWGEIRCQGPGGKGAGVYEFGPMVFADEADDGSILTGRVDEADLEFVYSNPNASGDTEEWTASGGGAGVYTEWDEGVVPDTATYNYMASDTGTFVQLSHMANPSVPSGKEILAVVVSCFNIRLNDVDPFFRVIISGENAVTGPITFPAGANNHATWQLLKTPELSADWTDAAVNSLQAGGIVTVAANVGHRLNTISVGVLYGTVVGGVTRRRYAGAVI